MKRSEAAKCVSMLVVAYPTAKISQETIDVYVTMTSDLEFPALERAVARVISTGKFFPTIAELRESARSIVAAPLRSGADAWLDIVEQIRAVGYCGKPRFADPVVAEIVRRWGWVSLCKEGDDTADRARFIQMYDAIAKQRWLDDVSGIPTHRLTADSVKKLAEGIGNGGGK